MIIPTEWKQAYLQEILQKKLIDEPLINYILAFINKNALILDNLHFVQKAQYAKRGLVIWRTNKETQISLYLDGYRVAQPSIIYQKLNQAMTEPLYIEFRGLQISRNLVKVYENNPYLSFEEEYSQDNRDYVDLFINLQALEAEENKILNEIEQVITLNNVIKFTDLSHEYRRIQIAKQNYLDEVEN